LARYKAGVEAETGVTATGQERVFLKFSFEN
jgi:hypothetical protein